MHFGTVVGDKALKMNNIFVSFVLKNMGQVHLVLSLLEHAARVCRMSLEGVVQQYCLFLNPSICFKK